jgi:hypothetical protein
MTWLVFPLSPLPAETTRERDWGENTFNYDSGAFQGMTPYQKPLYMWDIPFKNINELKQGPLATFVDSLRGMVTPFLMKDPYDFRVNSVLSVRSGINTGTFYIYDANSFFVRPDTTYIGSMFSSLSGFVLLGTNYAIDQDTGVMSIITKSNTDAWGVRSLQYYRKCVFDSRYRERNVMWNQFQIGVRVREIL